MPERTTSLVIALVMGLFVSEAADVRHLHTLPMAALIWILIVYVQSTHRCRLCGFSVSPQTRHCLKCGTENVPPPPTWLLALIICVIILALTWLTDECRLCRFVSDACIICQSRPISGGPHG